MADFDDNTNFPIISRKTVAGDSIQTVDARELHAFLGIGKHFSSWITERINSFGFEAEKDFFPITQNRVFGIFSKDTTEYALSLDMAKELAMVERNEKGRQARHYFIAAEKKLRELSAVTALKGADVELKALLEFAGGLSKTQTDMLKRAIRLSIIPKHLALARIIAADKMGMDWSALRLNTNERPHRLKKAVADCLALCLIKAAPKSMLETSKAVAVSAEQGGLF